MSAVRRPSARFSIVHKALDDIAERLMDMPVTPEVIELHREAGRMNREVLRWTTEPPPDAHKAHVVEQVLALTLKVMRAARRPSTAPGG